MLRWAAADVEAFEIRQQQLQGCFEARCSCPMLTVCLPAPDFAQPINSTRLSVIACIFSLHNAKRNRMPKATEFLYACSLLAYPFTCDMYVCIHLMLIKPAKPVHPIAVSVPCIWPASVADQDCFDPVRGSRSAVLSTAVLREAAVFGS